MLSREEASTRVAFGVELLDRIRPGWDGRIDLGTLTLTSCYRCVLAQVFGSTYGHGVSMLPLAKRPHWSVQAEALGFYLEEDDYGPLQDAWVELIADRRLKASAEIVEIHEAVAVPVLA